MKALFVLLSIITLGIFGLVWALCSDTGCVGPFEWLRQRNRAWHEKHDATTMMGTKPGTIRIVEKMRENGSVYYVAEIYGRWTDEYRYTIDMPTFRARADREWTEMRFPEWVNNDFPDVGQAMEAASKEVDRRQVIDTEKAEKAKRANYSKVMGAYTP